MHASSCSMPCQAPRTVVGFDQARVPPSAPPRLTDNANLLTENAKLHD